MRTAILYFVILVCAVGVSAQAKRSTSDWESKPVDKWDDKEVGYLLNESPWSRVLAGWARSGALVKEGTLRFRLQSALTVRLAILRKRQLSENYDSMDLKAKAGFSRKHKANLECSLCSKYYIVAVQEDSGVFSKVGIVKGREEKIYLSNENGERRTLERFSPPTPGGNESLFFFPRNNDKGDPLLNADNEIVIFNFMSDEDDEAVIKLLERVSINVRDIVRDGKVIF